MESSAWLTIPNLLTLLRLVLIVPFARFAMAGEDAAALAVFFIAGLTDTIDGTIARRFGQASKWGRLFDPLVDKLLTGSAFVVLAAFRPGLRAIPMWVMWAVLLRDALILVGSAAIYGRSRNSGFKPSIWGKLNTFIEIGVVVWFLASSGLPGIAAPLPAFYVLLLISLLISTIDYARMGAGMAAASNK